MKTLDPFRVAFVLAALTAVRAIGPDIVPGIGDIATHPNELIFGFFSIQLFGFLTVALPRWIGKPITPAPALWAVLGAQAIAFLWGCFDLEMGGVLRALATLSGVVLLLSTTPPGKTVETLPILALAALHALIGIAAFLHGWSGATMAGLAVIVLICIEVSNRIGIAVLAVARERAGYPKLTPVPALIALPQRAFTILALALWGARLECRLAGARRLPVRHGLARPYRAVAHQALCRLRHPGGRPCLETTGVSPVGAEGPRRRRHLAFRGHPCLRGRWSGNARHRHRHLHRPQKRTSDR